MDTQKKTQREIKFRLRIGNRIVGFEKWYPGAGLAALPRWLYSKDGKYWNPDYIFHDSKDQFTGLKDKNGKEIWEGDIVKSCVGELGEVIFLAWQAFSGFTVKSIPQEGYGPGFFQLTGIWDDIEVIGNIYKNPELIGANP